MQINNQQQKCKQNSAVFQQGHTTWKKTAPVQIIPSTHIEGGTNITINKA